MLADSDLGPLALELAAGAGDGHAPAGAHLQKVDLDFGNTASMLKNILDTGQITPAYRCRLLPAARIARATSRNIMTTITLCGNSGV
jgi:hypothetical protein